MAPVPAPVARTSQSSASSSDGLGRGPETDEPEPMRRYLSIGKGASEDQDNQDKVALEDLETATDSDSSEVELIKCVEEQLQDLGGPGEYLVVERGATLTTDCTDIRPLRIGERFAVVEVCRVPDTGIIRGRISNPAGWVSILDVDCNECWMERQDSVFSLLEEKAKYSKKLSLGSSSDEERISFGERRHLLLGPELDHVATGLGYTCRKGLKPEAPNQDAWTIIKVDGNFSIYGVFDGHGPKGHVISNMVREELPKLIIGDARFRTDDMAQMLRDNFAEMQRLIFEADKLWSVQAKVSGTTATIAIHDHVQGKLTIAHVADSTCVIGRSEAGADGVADVLRGTALTRDHKPCLSDETERIEDAGGRVIFDGHSSHRVYAKEGHYPGLNMSRSLGDLAGHEKAGLSCEPEVRELTIGPADALLLLCTDGVWEFIEPDEAVGIVSKFGPGETMEAAQFLAKESWDRWIKEEGGKVVDDITVLLVNLQRCRDAEHVFWA